MAAFFSKIKKFLSNLFASNLEADTIGAQEESRSFEETTEILSPIASEKIEEKIPSYIQDEINDGSASSPDWQYIADNCWLDEEAKPSLKWVVNKINSGISRYKEVEAETRVPWYVIAILHLRECSLDFRGVLHNGEKIIGKGVKTKLVPAGKGPFSTWEGAAIDALKHDGLTSVTDWSLGNILAMTEKFNGLGYRKKIGDSGSIEYSPYITAGTNWSDETGKYVRDRVFDPSAKESQLGVLAILIGLGIVAENKKSVEGVKKPVSEVPGWFTIAKGELGVTEISGSRHNSRVVEYHKSTLLKATDDETPWCSSFVCWCIEMAGGESTKNAWARSYLSWGRKLDSPITGCIAVFSRGDKSGHVAFFVEDAGDYIKVLGGNQNNTVSISSYPKSRLLGYRWKG